MTFLDEVFGQLATALKGLAGFITPLAATIFPWLYDLVTSLVTAVRGTAQHLASAMFALRDWAVAELAKVQAAIAGALAAIAAVTQDLAHLDEVLVERTRQYLLARVAAAPLGVLSEALQVAHRAGGPLSVPDVNQGAPWAVLEEAAGHLLAWGTDAAHPAFVALTEAAADMRAAEAGTPAVIPQPATTPQGTPGFPDLADPAGADPFASGLLTDNDTAYVQSTTRGAA